MVDYDYYEDKYENTNSKTYRANLLAELGDWSFHPKYRRAYKRSWKDYRKNQYRQKDTTTSTKTRKPKEREHWRYSIEPQSFSNINYRYSRDMSLLDHSVRRYSTLLKARQGDYLKINNKFAMVWNTDRQQIRLDDGWWYTYKELDHEGTSWKLFEYKEIAVVQYDYETNIYSYENEKHMFVKEVA